MANEIHLLSWANIHRDLRFVHVDIDWLCNLPHTKWD